MGDIIIGRHNTLEEIKNDIFVCTPGESGRCHSIMGAGDVGKTTLCRKWIQEFEKKEHANVFCVYFDFMSQESLSWFWRDMFDRIFSVIDEDAVRNAPNQDDFYKKKIEDARAFFCGDEWANRIEEPAYKGHELRHLNSVFNAITKLGMHLILVIDEFDRAREYFINGDNADGSLFQRLFSWTEKGGSGNNYNLTMLLISRRRVGTIAHHMAVGSDFEAGFVPKALHGFTDEELEEYFDSYNSLQNGKITDEMKQSIIYFCGRHPGLLMAFRDAAKRESNLAEWNVQKVFQNNRLRIEKIYERLAKLLREEYMDTMKTINCVDTFIQIFIGPAFSDNLPERMLRLEQYGLAYQTIGKNVFQLAGMTTYNSYGLCRKIEPLSAYFVEYMRNTVIADDLEGIGKLLAQTEREIRNLIVSVMEKNYPNHVIDKISSYNVSKNSYMQTLDNIAKSEDAELRGIKITKLNVLAFKDYAKIISDEWKCFARYFGGNDCLEEMKVDFNFLHSMRNVKAHENIEILSNDSRKYLWDTCEKILLRINKGDSEEDNAESRFGMESVAEVEALHVIPKGEIVEFFPYEFRPKVVKGTVNGQRASINKKILSPNQKGKIKEAIDNNKSVKAKMGYINPQNNGYILIWSEE